VSSCSRGKDRRSIGTLRRWREKFDWMLAMRVNECMKRGTGYEIDRAGLDRIDHAHLARTAIMQVDEGGQQ
jgi:hypothetical protein